MNPLLLGCIAVVVVGASALSAAARRRALQRRRQIPAVAAAKGLSFSAGDPFGATRISFDLFGQGDGRRVESVVWSDADTTPGASQARVFDYGYYTISHDRRGGERHNWHWFSCAMAEPDGQWPKLTIQHERMRDKALELVGQDPIHFESDEFNQTFRVTSDDRRFASALIDPQMMQFLLETRGAISFSTLGRHLLLVSHEVAPDEMPILLGLADEFVRRIPAAVWELYPKFVVAAGADSAGVPAGDDAAAARVSDPDAPGTDATDRTDTTDAWDPTPGVDYDLEGHAVTPEPEDPWHDRPVPDHDPRPPDRID